MTALIVGNCGLGVAPATEEAAEILSSVNGWMTPEGVAPQVLTIDDYLNRLEVNGIVLNVGTLIPHGPLRISAMGLSSGVPSPQQLRLMRQAVDQALKTGVFGLSTGLIYPPGMYADTEELVQLAQEVGPRNRLFTAHIRGSSETLLAATKQLIEIARRSGVRVRHSHLEAVGERFWPDVAKVLALEDRARGEGLRITHDVFPYTRAATMMSAIFPPWSLDGGVSSLLERLRDLDIRSRIRREVETKVPEWPPWQQGGWPHNLVEAVGWDGILVTSVRPGAPDEFVGGRLSEIADQERRDPFDVVADLMLAQEGQVGQQVDEISGRDGRLEVLLSILTHPAAAVISDAEDYGRGSPHPAHAGAFVRVLLLSRQLGVMPLEEAVRRMTAYPSSIVGLTDRGVTRVGSWADLVVFDPAKGADRATWDDPRLAAEGIQWVLINGQVVVDEGGYRGGLAGQVLRAANAGFP